MSAFSDAYDELEEKYIKLSDENKKMRKALRSCLALARRVEKDGDYMAPYIIRFCSEAGIKPSLLRVREDV